MITRINKIYIFNEFNASMVSIWVYVIISVLFVSFVAIIGILPFLIRKRPSQKALLLLVSLSAGTLFGGAFFHLLPEGIALGGLNIGTMVYVMVGLLTLFVVEKFVHWRHSHEHPDMEHKHAHGHAYHLAPMNIIGDGVHNFIDGLAIAGTYLVSIPLGIVATISVILHEVPQEIADFGVLLYSGMSRKKALLFNFLSAVTAIAGAVVGLILGSRVAGFTEFVLPFAAGNFLYIAGSNLVPELHKRCGMKESLLHLIMILIGIGIMIGLLFIGGHSH